MWWWRIRRIWQSATPGRRSITMWRSISRIASRICSLCSLNAAGRWRRKMAIRRWLRNTRGCSCPALKSCVQSCWQSILSIWRTSAQGRLRRSAAKWCRPHRLSSVRATLRTIRESIAVWSSQLLSKGKRICSSLAKTGMQQYSPTSLKSPALRWRIISQKRFFVRSKHSSLFQNTELQD